MAAVAQEQNPAAESTLPTVNVVDTALEANPNAEPGVPYKAKYSGDERKRRALGETAQNIQVLTKAQIEDSGYTDLREILDAQPGITLGTGENGNAFGDRYNQGWQEVEYFVNQTNLHLDREIGGLKHELIFALEYSDHSVLNGVYNVRNSGENCMVPGRGGVSSGWCITDASGALLNGINAIMNRSVVKGTWDSDWNVKTVSLSVMDTVDLTDKWTAFAGLRWDRFDYDLGTQNTTTFARTDFSTSDSLWNGHVGLTYKFRPDANVYASYSTASDVNGGESDVGTNAGYGGFIPGSAAPEKTELLELGTKWNLMGEKLLATAAAFQITKSDVMEGNGYEATGTFNSSKNRVRGIELGLTGLITDRLTAQAGVAIMGAEVLESATPPRVGRTLSNFADKSAFAQLKYQATDAFSFGGAVKYESEKYAGQPDTAAGFDAATGQYSNPIPAYTVLDLFANYRINKNMDVRLNVGNVTDFASGKG